ncbi:hypothetical protein N656DRAFT_761206 [Canariomyces notabilis]|uniref:Uncharacterized protein n=1 Tax=Canariomyces notabilis TaxID=2074819 RepID=A0AAN6T988_9PEZI|nr:hypothetical protein N656DRAFT_761206 [Canariomyces arenarius]
MRPTRRAQITIILIASAVKVRAVYKWSECEERVRAIQRGDLTLGHIDNTTIDQYLYFGPVAGATASLPREDYLTVTYEGCKVICGDPIAINETRSALALASNWLFPLAIVLSLPWESLHERKLSRTLVAVVNWLGSPQTSLTATIFNFRQFRESHRRVLREVNTDQSHLYSAAYFVLCSINQFTGYSLVSKGNDGPEPTRMLSVLMYGLFRPMSQEQAPDVELTEQLLLALAFELRMLRRKGVIPMLADLGTFIVAFIFSVVLAFADLDGDNTPFSLAFGLLVTWVPLLVVFTIVDRNPMSSDRTAELISRWLYNVDAVMTWADTGSPTPTPEWWTTASTIPKALRVGEFIGQGRKIEYCGLPKAVLHATNTVNLQRETTAGLETCAQEVAKVLGQGKTLSWYVVAVLSFLLVWTAIMSAFVLHFHAPTVGLGCRTLSYLVFGFLSSVSWAIQFFRTLPPWAHWVSYIFNGLAILVMTEIIILQLTGLANNCYCRSSALGMPLWGGYLDFKDPGYYLEHFYVIHYWTGAAVVGGLVPAIAFVTALFWWLKCKHLWKANERGTQYRMYTVNADTRWLGQ